MCYHTCSGDFPLAEVLNPLPSIFGNSHERFSSSDIMRHYPSRDKLLSGRSRVLSNQVASSS